MEKTCALTCNDPSDNKLCKDFTADMKAALATTTTAAAVPPPGPGPVPGANFIVFEKLHRKNIDCLAN
jgi:hypothetical protein